MKLLMICTNEDRADDVIELLEAFPVGGYSLIGHIKGIGKSGKHLGHYPFESFSAILMTVLSEEQASVVIDKIRTCITDEQGESIRVFSLEASVEI